MHRGSDLASDLQSGIQRWVVSLWWNIHGAVVTGLTWNGFPLCVPVTLQQLWSPSRQDAFAWKHLRARGQHPIIWRLRCCGRDRRCYPGRARYLCAANTSMWNFHSIQSCTALQHHAFRWYLAYAVWGRRRSIVNIRTRLPARAEHEGRRIIVYLHGEVLMYICSHLQSASSQPKGLRRKLSNRPSSSPTSASVLLCSLVPLRRSLHLRFLSVLLLLSSQQSLTSLCSRCVV